MLGKRSIFLDEIDMMLVTGDTNPIVTAEMRTPPIKHHQHFSGSLRRRTREAKASEVVLLIGREER